MQPRAAHLDPATPIAHGTRRPLTTPTMRCALARGASGCTPLGLAPPAYSRSQVQPLPWRRPRDASAAAHSTPLSRANPSDRPPSLTRVLAPPARISATSRECHSVSAAARATRALACTSHRGHHLQPLLDSLQEFIRSTCSNSSSCRPPVTSSCSSSLLRRRLLTSRCALICSG